MNHPKFMPTLIENAGEAFMQSLSRIVEDDQSFNEKSLSGELITRFGEALEAASGEACRTGLKEFIESQDAVSESVVEGGKKHNFKMVISKPFLSRFGVIEISRRAYYHWRKSPGLFPLDQKMDMVGRYVMPDVVEFLLYGAGKLTPKELEGMFQAL